MCAHPQDKRRTNNKNGYSLEHLRPELWISLDYEAMPERSVDDFQYIDILTIHKHRMVQFAKNKHP